MFAGESISIGIEIVWISRILGKVLLGILAIAEVFTVVKITRVRCCLCHAYIDGSEQGSSRHQDPNYLHSHLPRDVHLTYTYRQRKNRL